EGVFIVAYGMGGHSAGEVASEMAVRIIGQQLKGAAGRSDEEVASVIRDAIRESNNAILQRTLTEVDKRGMGTTATSMLINGQHYGDHRAHRLGTGQDIR